MSAARSAKFKFALEIKSGPKKGQRIDFDQDRVTLGRSPENTASFASDPKVSRRHAAIEVMRDSVIISNVSEKNVLKVNGKEVRSETLNDGDKITLGTSEIIFRFVKFGVAKAETEDNLILVPNNTPVPPQGRPGQLPHAGSHGVAHPSAPPPPAGQQQAEQWEAKEPKKSKTTFYLIVGAIGLFFVWIFTSTTTPPEEVLQLRTQEQITTEVETSGKTTQAELEQREKSGKNSRQFLKAQAKFVKGRRDFQQRQFSRAIQSFQAALSIFPEHALARQYLRLSRRKFDEIIQLTMIQGRKYKEKGNYKMCKSNYGLVMTMIRDNQKSSYREAKQFHDECAVMLEGRY